MDDLIIIGAGISGMTASIFASRLGVGHLLFGQEVGGQGSLAHLVENYPGFLSIKGPELIRRIRKQVESYGVKIRRERVVGLKTKNSNQFLVKTASGDEYQTRTLILAMGASYRHLNIPGEERFLGRGVSYCTSCDAPLFKDKVVAVVGGGNAAVTGALHLSEFAKKVYLLHRRDEFRAEKAWVEKLKKRKNIEIFLSTVVKEVLGKKRVEGIKAQSSKLKAQSLAVDGVFIEIGRVPSSVLAKEVGVEVDERGYILVDPNMATNISGVFASGDIARQKGEVPLRQLVTAAASGAQAAFSAYQFLTKKSPAPSWGKCT